MLVFLFVSHLCVSAAVQSGIFGGHEAKPHSRPYMASLQVRGHHLCGGVLIREDFVLTAAHCLNGLSEPLQVVLGAHNISDGDESSQQTILVKKGECHRHPQFTHPKQTHFDIMLLQLKTKAELNENVNVLELPRGLKKIPSKLQCEVAGWGKRILGRRTESVLYEAKVTLANNKDCRNKAGNYFSVDQMACSFSKGTDGFCQGDSGGPLVCRHNNRHILYGLEASTGQPCDTADYPQIYMSVPFFLPWIKLVLQGGGSHFLNGTYAMLP